MIKAHDTVIYSASPFQAQPPSAPSKKGDAEVEREEGWREREESEREEVWREREESEREEVWRGREEVLCSRGKVVAQRW
eukprot:gene15755-biopygen10963